MKNSVLFLFIALSFVAKADIPLVPKTMEFGGMRLEITNAARSEIQSSVNRLHASKTFFQSYVEKANLYFPIIEAEFAKQGTPDAIKYLCIQESAFKGDAVSSSNAVGYWQFKEATAIEQGLRVDKFLDERKNIVSSSRAAARYHNYHNKSLDNWVYAVIAYNTGLGGVQNFYNVKYAGLKTMEINKQTHWYFLKFLAHVVAFQDYVGKDDRKAMLKVYEKTAGKTVKDYAHQHGMPTEELAQYNLWINHHRKIPADKAYAVIVPISFNEYMATAVDPKDTKATDQTPKEVKQHPADDKPGKVESDFGSHQKGAIALEVNHANTKNIRYKVNRVKAITAIKGDNISKLALKGGLVKSKFLKYNEMDSFEKLIPGQTYYLKKKKKRSSVLYHVVQHNESLWEISQKYGITQMAIIRKNRMTKTESFQPGRVLHLRILRQENEPIEYRKVENAPQTEQQIVEIQTEKEEQNEGTSEQMEARKLTTKPITYQGKEATYTHWVQAGETIEQLSRYYQVSQSEIKEWNGLTSDYLVTGSRVGIFESTARAIQDQKVTETPETDVQPTETRPAPIQQTIQKIDSTRTLHTETDHPNEVTKPDDSGRLYSQDTLETIQEVTPKVIEIKPVVSPENIQFKTIWVEPGTTLYGLSRAHQVTPEEIIALNQLKSTSLKAGDQIKIPIHSSTTLEKTEVPKTAVPVVSARKYMVQAGDTFYSVSRKLGVSVEELKVKNNKKTNALSVGEVLTY